MAWFYWFIWSIAKSIAWVLVGLKPVGGENIPREGAFILAANHQSYLDPPLISISIRREMCFFAKKELFKNFLFGWLISNLNAIPVNRRVFDPGSLEKVLERLSIGKGLILFPEGTRGNGKEFLKPKPGVGMLAIRADVAIVPAYAYRTNQFWQSVFNRRRVEIHFGRPIPVEKVRSFSRDKEGYKSLAQYVMEQIGRLKEAVLPVADVKANSE